MRARRRRHHFAAAPEPSSVAELRQYRDQLSIDELVRALICHQVESVLRSLSVDGTMTVRKPSAGLQFNLLRASALDLVGFTLTPEGRDGTLVGHYWITLRGRAVLRVLDRMNEQARSTIPPLDTIPLLGLFGRAR